MLTFKSYYLKWDGKGLFHELAGGWVVRGDDLITCTWCLIAVSMQVPTPLWHVYVRNPCFAWGARWFPERSAFAPSGWLARLKMSEIVLMGWKLISSKCYFRNFNSGSNTWFRMIKAYIFRNSFPALILWRLWHMWSWWGSPLLLWRHRGMYDGLCNFFWGWPEEIKIWPIHI